MIAAEQEKKSSMSQKLIVSKFYDICHANKNGMLTGEMPRDATSSAGGAAMPYCICYAINMYLFEKFTKLQSQITE